jgi:uncharacterized protein YjbI with pentapeptide repeats
MVNTVLIALKKDRNVVTLHSEDIGSSFLWQNYAIDNPDHNVSDQLVDVVDIVISNNGYQTSIAALKEDGTVVVWGNEITGGRFKYHTRPELNPPSDDEEIDVTVNEVGNKVVKILPILNGFIAIKEDGSHVTWGNPYFSLINDVSQFRITRHQGYDIDIIGDFTDGGVISEVKEAGWENRWAILKDNGYVVTGGRAPQPPSDPTYNGDDPTYNGEWFPFNEDWNDGNIIRIFSTKYAFAALKRDGSVVTWGRAYSGGDSNNIDLNNGIINIVSSSYAFAALKNDGSVVLWGSWSGWSSDTVINQPNIADESSIIEMYSNEDHEFVLVKNDGSLIHLAQNIQERTEEYHVFLNESWIFTQFLPNQIEGDFEGAGFLREDKTITGNVQLSNTELQEIVFQIQNQPTSGVATIDEEGNWEYTPTQLNNTINDNFTIITQYNEQDYVKTISITMTKPDWLRIVETHRQALDLSGKNLKNLDLSGLKISNLSGATIDSNSNFSRCDLTGCDLTNLKIE